VIRSLRRAHGLKVGKVSDFFASIIISCLKDFTFGASNEVSNLKLTEIPWMEVNVGTWIMMSTLPLSTALHSQT
jgi:hypothetical protein